MADDSSNTPKCPRCGATAASDAPDGLCPRCLIGLNFVAETTATAAALSGPLGSFCRVAILGVVWALVFAVNWVWAYTPPGWKVTSALQDALGNWVVGLLQGPLAIVAFAAPVGVTVLGWIAMRKIRRSQGRLRGFALALADTVLFPLLLMNYWVIWLCQRIGAALSGVAQAGSPEATMVGLLLALMLDGILIVGLWRRCQKPLPPLLTLPDSSGAKTHPERDWRKLICTTVVRAALVGLVHLGLLETILQTTVHRPESTGELWLMALLSSSLAVMVWAAWPLCRSRFPGSAVTGGTLLLFAGLCGLDAFYSFWVRPNLGLYEEADWVAQHPGFQWGRRQAIANALWRKPLAGPFAPPVETVLPLDEEHPVTLLDLDTGRQVNRSGLDVGDEQTLAWIRAEQLDLAVVLKPKGIEMLGLGLGAGWVPHFVPRKELTAQAAVNFWLLDRKPVKEYSDLQVRTNLVGTLVFRTREGGVGVLELAGWSSHPRGVKLRRQLVQTGASDSP